MVAPSVETYMAAETRLTRSFIAAAVTWAVMLWVTLSWGRSFTSPGSMPLIAVTLLLLQLGSYVWYALSAGAAANLLGAPGWLYIGWILAAPFLGMLPIPIVSTVIAVSPLSIKFLLGGQLQSAIRERTVEELHGTR